MNTITETELLQRLNDRTAPGVVRTVDGVPSNDSSRFILQDRKTGALSSCPELHALIVGTFNEVRGTCKHCRHGSKLTSQCEHPAAYFAFNTIEHGEDGLLVSFDDRVAAFVETLAKELGKRFQ